MACHMATNTAEPAVDNDSTGYPEMMGNAQCNEHFLTAQNHHDFTHVEILSSDEAGSSLKTIARFWLQHGTISRATASSVTLLGIMSRFSLLGQATSIPLDVASVVGALHAMVIRISAHSLLSGAARHGTQAVQALISFVYNAWGLWMVGGGLAAYPTYPLTPVD
ncbi:hypothetical protein EK21DRAFT_91848 [Setomelanomma holmii]|uniref:Uncharacterized protein n=1 Tax=Setomelanomma holmii TaxID=210430 RepID=A0A9P4H4Q4_9PLEO|nr:hypothetical protein EK21DRAFT_91848 [Setomelanomma holmii]